MLISLWNNYFCFCICHVFVLCNIRLPTWKAYWWKKSYWCSYERFLTHWVLDGVSYVFDRYNFIIYTTNHIQCGLFDIIHKCVFDKFSSNIFAYSILYSTSLCILPWWMFECWCVRHETEDYHLEIHFDFVESFPQLFSSISRCTLGISNLNRRSNLR